MRFTTKAWLQLSTTQLLTQSNFSHSHETAQAACLHKFINAFTSHSDQSFSSHARSLRKFSLEALVFLSLVPTSNFGTEPSVWQPTLLNSLCSAQDVNGLLRYTSKCTSSIWLSIFNFLLTYSLLQNVLGFL